MLPISNKFLVVSDIFYDISNKKGCKEKMECKVYRESMNNDLCF